MEVTLKHWLVTATLGSLVAMGCGSGNGGTAAPATTTSTPATAIALSTTVPGTQAPDRATTATTLASTAPPTSPTQVAAKAIVEPDAVAGIPLGANKSDAIAILGPPTTSGQEADLSGKKYDYLRWQFSGNRGLFLNFRTEAVTSPRLTDWIATAAGPATKAGVQVGDGAAKVTGAYGALEAFCCDAKVASVIQGGGRMIVIVANDTQKVTRIVGGDPDFWSRSIAD